MDRVAVLVDAGYLFAQGSALVSTSSKKKRSDIEFDAQRAVQELRQFALKITGGLPLLRIYWYDAAQKSGPTVEQLPSRDADATWVRTIDFFDSGSPNSISLR